MTPLSVEQAHALLGLSGPCTPEAVHAAYTARHQELSARWQAAPDDAAREALKPHFEQLEAALQVANDNVGRTFCPSDAAQPQSASGRGESLFHTGQPEIPPGRTASPSHTGQPQAPPGRTSGPSHILQFTKIPIWPTGRAVGRSLAFLAACVGAGAVVGWLMELKNHYWFDWGAISAIMMGVLLTAALCGLVRLLRMAFSGFALLGTLLAVGAWFVSLRSSRHERFREGTSRLVDAVGISVERRTPELMDAYLKSRTGGTGLGAFMELEMEVGYPSRWRRKYRHTQGVGVLLDWALEFGLAGMMMGIFVYASAGRPFSLQVDTWFQRTASSYVPGSQSEAFLLLVRSGRLLEAMPYLKSQPDGALPQLRIDFLQAGGFQDASMQVIEESMGRDAQGSPDRKHKEVATYLLPPEVRAAMRAGG